MGSKAAGLRLAVAGLAAALAAAPAGAQCPAAKLRTYYRHQPGVVEDVTRTDCSAVTDSCHTVLKGYLFLPAVQHGFSGNYSFIVYNHGSEENPGQKCEIGEYFSALGYVVFVPHRRGHGKSTGMYLDQFVASPVLCPSGDAGKCKMDYLHRQEADVEAAINYVKTLFGRGPGIFRPRLVDPNRLAIMGHSFGGISTVFVNARHLGQKAAVDIAGGSQSWEGNDDARSEMRQAVRNAVAPTFFLEPMNDKSIEPTFMLATTAARACRVFQAAIYGPVDATGDGVINSADYVTDPDPTDDVTIGRDVAHGLFVKDHVAEWGPAAHEFMTRYFQKPAAPFDHRCQGTSSIP